MLKHNNEAAIAISLGPFLVRDFVVAKQYILRTYVEVSALVSKQIVSLAKLVAGHKCQTSFILNCFTGFSDSDDNDQIKLPLLGLSL